VEEDHFNSLCEALHDLADEIDAGGSYEAGWIPNRLRDIAGADTRKKAQP
jgi:hypothetical protein